MDRMDSMYFCLLSCWCVLQANRILMVVSAEPTVTARIITPEADRKEGGRVEMRCVATNLDGDHIVEWRTENQTLRWANNTIAADRRFMFETMQTMNGQTTQIFTITDLQKDDTDEYICTVNDPKPSGGSLIVATAKVNLTVLYFPSESFPICSPHGPITVDNGTQLIMCCFSETGNPAAMMIISQPSTGLNNYRYTWLMSNSGNALLALVDLTVDIDDHDVMFQCIINSTYFPDMNRFCTVGPIRVTGAIIPTVQPSTKSTVKTSVMQTEKREKLKTEPETATEPTTQSPANPTPSMIHSSAIAAAVAAGGVLLVAMAATIIFLCNRKHRCRNKGPTTRTETQVSNVDPYMELQKSTDEGNKEYMELGAKAATTSNTTRDGEANGGYVEPATVNDTPTESHAEYQAVEDDNESPKPDPKHTEYEVVQVP